MSTRVLNPARLSEFTKLRSPVRRHVPNTAALARIKKDLFGPVDQEDSRRFINREMAKHQTLAAHRWEFDFVRGQPLPDSTRFIWERVPPTIIPKMYTLSRAAHLRETSVNTVSELSDDDENNMTTDEELLDSRARNDHHHPHPHSHSHSHSHYSHFHHTRVTVQCSSSSNGELTVSSIGSSIGGGKRQSKMTDYLKPKKRLSPVIAKKLTSSPIKKARNSTTIRQLYKD